MRCPIDNLTSAGRPSAQRNKKVSRLVQGSHPTRHADPQNPKPQVVGALQELFFSSPRPQGAAAEQQHERRNTTSCTVSMTPASSGMQCTTLVDGGAGTTDVSCHCRWRAARFGSFRGRSRVGTDEVGRPIPKSPRGPTLVLWRAEQWLSSSSSP